MNALASHARFGAPLLLAILVFSPFQDRPIVKSGPFSHARHVRAEWILAGEGQEREFARDCRGCHDYSRPDAAAHRPYEATCRRCHHFQLPTFQGTPMADPSREQQRSFDHHQHWSMNCIECHRPEGNEIPDAMPVRSLSSPGACASCHGAEGQAREIRGRFNDAIDARLRAQEGSLRPFRHDTHFAALGASLTEADPSVCTQCHAEIPQSDAQTLGSRQFSIASCEECHPGRDYMLEHAERPSRTAATFVHRHHLSAKALADETIGPRGCLACHAYSEDKATFDLGSRFQVDDLQEGCVTCHVKWDKGGDHGSIDDCRQCHDFERATVKGFVDIAALPKNRPRVEVDWQMPAAFDIAEQSHEFITGGADARCSECHVAQIEALPSRISGHKFSHRTHLGADLPADDQACLRCHHGMAQASSLADIAVPPAPGPVPLFETADCRSCHFSQRITAHPADAAAPRTMLSFSHLDHLRSKHPLTGEMLTCLDCHLADVAKLDERVGVKPEVLSCTQCHGHREHASTTGGHDLDEVSSCVNCHKIGVPVRDEGVPVERTRIAGAQGPRSHPKVEDDCSRCHPPSVDIDWQPTRIHDLVIEKREDMPHKRRNIPEGELFFGDLDLPASNPARKTWCIDCHWALPIVPLYEEQKNWAKYQEWYQEHPLESDWRRAYGDMIDAGFPGFELRD